MNNSKIVNELVKIDLHIHSIYSENKDGAKVQFNSLDNINVLLEKFKENELNMISITDHNNFNFEMYKKIKNEIPNHKTLKRILPGIEFDVILEKRIHVITIFNDTNEEKVENIEKVIKAHKLTKKESGYQEKDFKEIIQSIGLDTILIVHQKCDVNSTSKQKQNLGSLGVEKFDEFINIDYFDAVEFRTSRVEGILNNYKKDHGLTNLRYIVGTDCHNWKYYPKKDEDDESDIKFSYIKALPTFKGLVMAVTEQKRITVDSYSLKRIQQKEINIQIDEKKYNIPLSSGLNVIIGDNSVGKSYLLRKLYDSTFANNISGESIQLRGYHNFQEKNKIEVYPIDIKNQMIFISNQGDIRNKFEGKDNLWNVDFLKNKFPDFPINSIRDKLETYVDLFLKKTKLNQEIFDKTNILSYSITIPSEVEYKSYNLQLTKEIENKVITYKTLIDDIESSIILFNKLAIDNLEEEDLKFIKDTSKHLEDLKLKYVNLNKKEKNISTVKNAISLIFDKNIKRIKLESQNQQSLRVIYNSEIINFAKKISDCIEIDNKEPIEIFKDFEPISALPESNVFEKYKFVSRLKTNEFLKKDIEDMLIYPFRKESKNKLLGGLKNSELKAAFNKNLLKKQDDKLNADDCYSNIVLEYINNELLSLESIILNDKDDLSSGNSPGKNALIYLDIFANEKKYNLVLLDQPDDDVSQNKITTDLINIFRQIASEKQVIFVTHKPELVVNLDVDNVIVMKRDYNGKIIISCGALEYQDENTNILEEVAKTLDGGAEIIRKRWKRYAKRKN